jgi:thiol-disulfide isomerase/thioredoxin
MKILLTVIVASLSFLQVFSQSSRRINPAAVAIFDRLNNKPFAALAMEDTSGAIFNTASLIGKTLYVDFWFTACAPCVKEIPYSNALQKYFSKDTNIVFLNICIDNNERKTVWKEMVRDKQMKGIHVFYARNSPQKVNFLREYNIMFPTYLLVNNEFKIIGYDAPRPSQNGWVHWAITQAAENVYLSAAYKKLINHSKEYKAFSTKNKGEIMSLNNEADTQ